MYIRVSCKHLPRQTSLHVRLLLHGAHTTKQQAPRQHTVRNSTLKLAEDLVHHGGVTSSRRVRDGQREERSWEGAIGVGYALGGLHRGKIRSPGSLFTEERMYPKQGWNLRLVLGLGSRNEGRNQ